MTEDQKKQIKFIIENARTVPVENCDTDYFVDQIVEVLEKNNAR